MALPITIPYTFATATSSIPLSQLDSDFTTVVNAINGIGNGTNSLSNVSITGGSIDNVTIGGTTSSTGRFSTVTATTGNITTINATTLNAATHRSDTSLTFQTNGTTTAMTVDTSQNVGIGTATPATKLDVAGNINFSGNIFGGNTSGIFFNGFGNYGAGVLAAVSGTNLVLQAGSAERMRINSSGNVGIGTSSPSYPLSISRSGANAYLYQSDGIGTMLTGSNGSGLGVSGTFSNTDMAFFSNSAERMRIDTSGNVGIGTSSPTTYDSKLAVIGNLSLANTGNKFYPYYVSSTNNNYISSAAGGEMTFGTGISGVSERMRIDTAGNVGIGTSSVSYPLVVSKNQNSATVIQLLNSNTGASAQGILQVQIGASSYVNYTTAPTYNQIVGSGISTNYIDFDTQIFRTNSGTERMRIDTSGNVGIGTSSPGAKLQVSGSTVSSNFAFGTTTAAAGQIASDTGYAGARVVFYGSTSGGGGTLDMYAGGTAPIQFSTNGSERMRIDSSGNLLVGTTSASGRITSKTTTTDNTTYPLYMQNSAGSTVGFFRSDGNFNTGTLTFAPYNNTTAAAANMYVSSSGDVLRSTSSLRYKENVQDATHGLSDVLKLRSVIYNGKNDGGKKFGGFIAEEIDAAGLDEFVLYDNEGRPDALHYGNMVALMAKAIQELKAELDALKGTK